MKILLIFLASYTLWLVLFLAYFKEELHRVLPQRRHKVSFLLLSPFLCFAVGVLGILFALYRAVRCIR